jgi:hypothetical protein
MANHVDVSTSAPMPCSGSGRTYMARFLGNRAFVYVIVFSTISAAGTVSIYRGMLSGKSATKFLELSDNSRQIDLGTLWASRQHRAEILVRNSSAVPIVIDKIAPDCTCTVPTTQLLTIPAQEVKPLELFLDLTPKERSAKEHNIWPFRSKLRLSSSTWKESRDYTISAVVRAYPLGPLSSPFSFAERYESGSPAPEFIATFSVDPVVATVEATTASPPSLRVDVGPARSGQGIWQLSVTVATDMVPGEHFVGFGLQPTLTSGAKLPPIRYSTVFEIGGLFRLSPKTIVLQPVPIGTAQPVVLWVEARNHDHASIESVTSDSNDLEVSFEELDGSRLALRVIPKAEMNSAVDVEVHFRTSATLETARVRLVVRATNDAVH